jgi:hypothetical protein
VHWEVVGKEEEVMEAETSVEESTEALAAEAFVEMATLAAQMAASLADAWAAAKAAGALVVADLAVGSEVAPPVEVTEVRAVAGGAADSGGGALAVVETEAGAREVAASEAEASAVADSARETLEAGLAAVPRRACAPAGCQSGPQNQGWSAQVTETRRAKTPPSKLQAPWAFHSVLQKTPV